MNSAVFACDLISDAAPINYIQEDDLFRNNKLNDVTNLINGEISILMKNFNPFYQNELDEKL